MNKTLYLLIAIIISCSSKKGYDYVKSELMPILKDSTNLADLGAYVVSDFNYAKADNDRTFIVDFFGGQVLGFKNGKELFFSLTINDIPKLESNWQVGNIAYSDKGAFLFFPMMKKIIQLDAKNQYLKTINIGYQDNISCDKFNSLFEFNPRDSLFYITLHRDTYNRNEYNDVPLIGAFNVDGKLVESFGEYPENYKNLEGDKSAWKFSFFDKDEDFYYAMFNRNNYVYKYDKGFNLIEKIQLPKDFIAEKDYHGKILNAFKKQPGRNVFFLITNETFLQTDGTEGVYVDLKWFNADNNTYGILPLQNYMRIHQITEEGTLILLDRNTYEDAYFYLYDFNKKG